MNLYFSYSLNGGREDQQVYLRLVEHLESRGHEVPTSRLANADIIENEGNLSPEHVYQRDIDWIHECDAMVAEVSTPSHGVGYEIGVALRLGKPVCCIFQAERNVSKMILGNPDENLITKSYQNIEEAAGIIDNFLNKVNNGDRHHIP
jgi:nucleoside 2-deoxyribosyltransferase